VCVRDFGARRAVIVIWILCAESASATNNKGDTHMIMTETSISTDQRSFGIAGLTRSELHEIQLVIEALRRPNSDIERISERAEGAERAPDQSECDEAERNTVSTDAGMTPQSCRAPVPAAGNQSGNQSNTYPMKALYSERTGNCSILDAQRRTRRFLAIRNLYVLLPKRAFDRIPGTRRTGRLRSQNRVLLVGGP